MVSFRLAPGLSLCLAAAGCAPLGGPVPAADVAAMPAAPPAAMPDPPRDAAPSPPRSALAGDYTSDWGPVRIDGDGDSISAAYGGGVMSCAARGDRVDCSWFEASGGGRAVFQRSGDGTLSGTWGNGTSATDGGAWSLTPLRGGGLTGIYESNWGLTSFDDAGAVVRVRWRTGSMVCRGGAGSGTRSLDCEWTQGDKGRATLRVDSPRAVRGTWGNGASAVDGGPWVFVRR
jgi:hypothetical protein